MAIIPFKLNFKEVYIMFDIFNKDKKISSLDLNLKGRNHQDNFYSSSTYNNNFQFCKFCNSNQRFEYDRCTKCNNN